MMFYRLFGWFDHIFRCLTLQRTSDLGGTGRSSWLLCFFTAASFRAYGKTNNQAIICKRESSFPSCFFSFASGPSFVLSTSDSKLQKSTLSKQLKEQNR